MNNNELFQWRNIRFVPIVHNRIEFALEVRRQFASFQPDILALEYPPALENKIIEGVKRLPLLSVVYYEEDDHTFIYLPVEPSDGQIEAIRLALEDNIPIHFIDRDVEGYPIDRSPMPDSYSINRIGYRQYCRAYLKINPEGLNSPQDLLREKTMAFNLQQLGRDGKKILYVCGLAHITGLLKLLDIPQVQVIGRKKRDGIMLAHLHMESSREIMTEIPFFLSFYEKFRNGNSFSEPDRLEAIDQLIGRARENHLKKNKEEVTAAHLKIFNKFVMNYAILGGYLTPDLYQIIIAARGAVDDNFAYEVWDAATEYPWQTESPGLPILHLNGKDLFLNDRKIRFHRHFKRMRKTLVPVPIRKRRKEESPGEWNRGFKDHSICSFQPEDIVIEGFGNYLRKKALKEKSEENSRVSPFLGSMMDGIDIRETIRNWKDGRLYVLENTPFKGKVGSVVLIFDPDLPDNEGKEKFPWRVTWLGEHNQESDMAFYGTPAGEVMVGPGISRCQYGGFMLTFPPLRVYDIWKDQLFDIAKNKSERLLLAAVDYSLERYIVYVASTPPSSICKSFASRMRKKIIYLPAGTFSSVTLKKVRQFHVLDGHPVRLYASRYIK